jgi:hypothetical protein
MPEPTTTAAPTEGGEKTPTIDEIARAFSQTIFWNYGLPFPGDDRCEPEPELAISYRPSEDPDERDTALLSFGSGECDIAVAEMRLIKAHEDAENGVTTADVEFIAKLPVYLPILLSAARRYERDYGQMVREVEAAAYRRGVRAARQQMCLAVDGMTAAALPPPSS